MKNKGLFIIFIILFILSASAAGIGYYEHTKKEPTVPNNNNSKDGKITYKYYLEDLEVEQMPTNEKILDDLGCSKDMIGKDELIKKLDSINLEEYKDKIGTDIYTLEDVIASLKKPNLDPRDEMPQPLLKSDVLDIKDLSIGMKLQGTVRNVVDFGAFIDIGLHNDGLAHISKLTTKYIKHPSEVVSVGDIVDCYVDDISLEKGKVSLSLLPR